MSSIPKSVVNMKRCFLHHEYNRFSLKTKKLPCGHKLSVKSVNANDHLRKKKRSIETSWMCEDFGDFTETVKTKNGYNAQKIIYVNPQNGENQKKKQVAGLEDLGKSIYLKVL